MYEGLLIFFLTTVCESTIVSIKTSIKEKGLNRQTVFKTACMIQILTRHMHKN